VTEAASRNAGRNANRVTVLPPFTTKEVLLARHTVETQRTEGYRSKLELSAWYVDVRS